MRKSQISVTEAARHFADCVNRVRYQRVSFDLMKNGVPVACLTPGDHRSCTGRDLAAALARTELPAAEAAAWGRDLRIARKRLKPSSSRW